MTQLLLTVALPPNQLPFAWKVHHVFPTLQEWCQYAITSCTDATPILQEILSFLQSPALQITHNLKSAQVLAISACTANGQPHCVGNLQGQVSEPGCRAVNTMTWTDAVAPSYLNLPSLAFSPSYLQSILQLLQPLLVQAQHSRLSC